MQIECLLELQSYYSQVEQNYSDSKWAITIEFIDSGNVVFVFRDKTPEYFGLRSYGPHEETQLLDAIAGMLIDEFSVYRGSIYPYLAPNSLIDFRSTIISV